VAGVAGSLYLHLSGELKLAALFDEGVDIRQLMTVKAVFFLLKKDVDVLFVVKFRIRRLVIKL
jgi:hypothetical protein